MSALKWFAIKLDNDIQIAERAETHEEALKLARDRVAKWEGAPKCVAVGLLVLLAATDDLEGWFTAAEIDESTLSPGDRLWVETICRDKRIMRLAVDDLRIELVGRSFPDTIVEAVVRRTRSDGNTYPVTMRDVGVRP